MANKILTDTKIEQILSKGVRDMPQNPASQGYTKDQIRAFYYKPEAEMLEAMSQIEDSIVGDGGIDERVVSLEKKITGKNGLESKVETLETDNDKNKEDIDALKEKTEILNIDNELNETSTNAVENQAIAKEFKKKQDKLTAGENITIKDGVISAQGGSLPEDFNPEDYVKFTDIAQPNGDYGLVKLGSASYGLIIAEKGQLAVGGTAIAQVKAQNGGYSPITTELIALGVKEGLINPEISRKPAGWTDEDRAKARETLGITSGGGSKIYKHTFEGVFASDDGAVNCSFNGYVYSTKSTPIVTINGISQEDTETVIGGNEKSVALFVDDMYDVMFDARPFNGYIWSFPEEIREFNCVVTEV